MRIRVDLERCRGHQSCIRASSELFSIGEDGFVRLQGNGDVPERLMDEARLAEDNCPEFAIEIENDEAR